MCTPSHLPRGSLRTSNPLREGPSANRNEHVGISRPGPQPRVGETTRLGSGTVLHRFEAALTSAYFGQDGWGGTGLLGKVVGVYSTASVQHRIELGTGLYRERQRNHRASLRAEDTRPRGGRHRRSRGRLVLGPPDPVRRRVASDSVGCPRRVARGAEAPPDSGGRAVGPVPGGRAVSLLSYLALGGLAAAVIFGLSTDVRAAARRLFRRR